MKRFKVDKIFLLPEHYHPFYYSKPQLQVPPLRKDNLLKVICLSESSKVFYKSLFYKTSIAIMVSRVLFCPTTLRIT